MFASSVRPRAAQAAVSHLRRIVFERLHQRKLARRAADCRKHMAAIRLRTISPETTEQQGDKATMSDKPNYRVNRRDVKMTERVAMAAVGNSVIRAQKVHGTDTSIMFAERASGYHTSPHMHDCDQINYIVSGEMYFFVDGRGYRCRVGDVMRIPRNKVHWAWNRGKETAVIFESHAPPLRDR